MGVLEDEVAARAVADLIRDGVLSRVVVHEWEGVSVGGGSDAVASHARQKEMVFVGRETTGTRGGGGELDKKEGEEEVGEGWMGGYET